MPPGYFAKTVFASSFLTLCIVAGLLVIFRQPLLATLLHQVTSPNTPVEQVVRITSEEQIVDVVARTNHAVVSVVATRDVPVFERFVETFETFDPFGGLFGDGGGFMIPRERQQGTEERMVGGGSGFLINREGMIVTNRHVVADDDSRYSVMFADGSTFDVEVLARDAIIDIAILQIIGDELPDVEPLSFGDSDQLQLGQTVIAIGNALAEFNNTVSVGVVSGLSRTIDARGPRGMIEQLDQVIQTDAAINLGNSGGPLLDVTGTVIGVNVAASLAGENIGFALPSNMVQQIVDSVQETGEILRPFLGVRHTTLTPRIAELEGIEQTYGALVVPGQPGSPDAAAVMPGSAAAEAGIQAGDVIVAIDGRSLATVSLAQALRSKAVGETISIQLWRNGETLMVEATLQAAP